MSQVFHSRLREVFVTARDITPMDHIRMQAVFQKWCDSSISKTINFPESATVEEVKKVYFEGYDLGLKGVTVYRDGSRSFQPMALKKPSVAKKPESQAPRMGEESPAGRFSPQSSRSEKKQKKEMDFPLFKTEEKNVSPGPKKIPEVMPALRLRQKTTFGTMHVKVIVEPKEGKEWEVFAQLGKAGELASSDLEGMCRLISLYLRSGGNLREVVRQLSGIGSTLVLPARGGRILSLADALASSLSRYLSLKEKFGLVRLLCGDYLPEELGEVREKRPTQVKKNSAYKIKCPECQGLLVMGEGCVTCPSCGYSHCG